MKPPAESFADLLADLVGLVAPMLDKLLEFAPHAWYGSPSVALRGAADPLEILAAEVRVAEEAFLDGVGKLRSATAAVTAVGHALPPIRWPATIEDTSQALKLLMHPDFPEASIARVLAQLGQLVDGPVVVHLVAEGPHRLATALRPLETPPATP